MFFIKKWTMLGHDQQVFLNPWYGAGLILATGDVAENKAEEILCPPETVTLSKSFQPQDC